MKHVSKAALLGMSVVVMACTSPDPIVVQPGRNSSGYYRQNDPLQSTARDANSVESIVSSIARVGRMVGGGY